MEVPQSDGGGAEPDLQDDRIEEGDRAQEPEGNGPSHGHLLTTLMLDTRARAADCNEYGWVLDDYDWWVSEEVRESRIKRSHALQRAKGGEDLGLDLISFNVLGGMHFDLCFDGGGVVHQKPVRGIVKVCQRDGIKSPRLMFGIVDAKNSIFLGSILPPADFTLNST